MGKGTASNLSKVVLLGATIGGISEHDVKRTAKDADDTEYGISWEKTLPVSKGASGTFKGKMREGDAGQAALLTAFEGQAIISDVKFYFGPNVYDTPDLDTDPDAGMIITGLQFSAKIQDVVTVSLDYKFTGPIKRVSV